ncbi:MAG: flagellar hook-associated protein FlgL [Microthrixaceae bacterium]
MITRVATNAGAFAMLGNLQRNDIALYKAQEQISSGRRINRLSDAPADAVNALSQRAQLRRLEQYGRNADEAQRWLSGTDSALMSVQDQLTSARSLLVTANSGVHTPESRASIAADLRGIREAMLQTANISSNGHPLFAGTKVVTAAYDGTGAYQGDEGVVAVPVGPSVTITANVSGTAVFGTASTVPAVPGDVFQVLESIATAIENGDTTAMSAGLGQIDDASKRVSQAQVLVGSRGKQIEGLVNDMGQQQVALKAGISKKEDADIAESVIGLKTQEAAYQAALQALSQVIRPTLMDFLR